MIDPAKLPEDPERIYLEPECCADPREGRMYAETNVWPLDDGCEASGVEYVRADLAREVLELRERVKVLESRVDEIVFLAAEAHTRHFNPGVLDTDPPRFEDADDMYEALLKEALALRDLLRGQGQ